MPDSIAAGAAVSIAGTAISIARAAVEFISTGTVLIGSHAWLTEPIQQYKSSHAGENYQVPPAALADIVESSCYQSQSRYKDDK